MSGSQVVESGTQRFLEAEGRGMQGGRWEGRTVAVAAIGTTAPEVVRGALLPKAIADRGMTLRSATPRAGPDELMADADWNLGVVLSPWKQQIGASCDSLSPSAEITGVVDSVLRTASGTVGFNTNTWSALSALEVVTGGRAPERLLLLGSGASARSVALAVSRGWPACELVVAGRRREPAEELAASFGGSVYDSSEDNAALMVVVNTTTWGETEASEAQPFGFDLERIFGPGGHLFDLNNRISALQHAALRAGCAVVSGSVMQRVTNACRAALLGYAR